jgi:hypothetical protein
MFSLDRFYNILHNNLISRFRNGRSVYFYPFGTYQNTIFLSDQVDTAQNQIPFIWNHHWQADKIFFHCYYFDQEPFYDYTKLELKKSMLTLDRDITGPRQINLLATSERSSIVSEYSRQNKFYSWYYFFHGFATLDWYRDFQYVNPDSFNRYDKVFICYNHLTSNLRSYRLHLGANLIEQDLVKHGRVSLFHEGWQNTIEDPENPLDNRARLKIYHALKNVAEPLTIDTPTPNGALSANVNFNELTSALWHIVTETVYFEPKLHLTEKIFKPIVARRPFILAAAPGNLAYLKSYGFRTFDQWIDESYDQEPDHYIRIEMITAEIKRLCLLDPADLKQMHREMQEVLEHNFNHFYGKFKDIIVDELVDNFAGVLRQINVGRMPNNHSRHHQRFELEDSYLEEVKKRLKQ